MLRFVAVLALVLSPLVVSQAFATETPEQRQVDVSGSYTSNWDDVKLTQDGNRVYGTYVCCGGGTIEGKIIEGRTLRYIWKQAGGWGLGVWTIKSGQLEGTWGVQQNEKDGGRWDLVRANAKSQSKIAK